MIIYDTETNGLLKHADLPLDQQPGIIELGILKLDDATLEEVGRLSVLVRPKVLPLDPTITKITGITTEMLTPALTFARHLPAMINLFLGERQIIAHNLPFDLGMTLVELRRLDYVTKFPWPPLQTDTTTLASDIPGASHTGRHKQAALYKIAFGTEPPVTHRAIEDAETLAAIVRWLRARDGRI